MDHASRWRPAPLWTTHLDGGPSCYGPHVSMEARPAMDHTSRWKPALLWTTHLDGGPPYYGPHVLVEARPAMDHTSRWRPALLLTTRLDGGPPFYGPHVLVEVHPAMDHTSRWRPALLWTTHLDGGPARYGPHLVELRLATDSLSKTILQGTLVGVRRRGWHRKCWMDNIKEWTSLPMPELLTVAYCRKHSKRISAESSAISQRRPTRSRD